MQKHDIIPIFPLTKVLFPRMILPLHIFEERYQEMIAFCREENQVFGVLHTHDVEAGSIGTTASVQRILEEYDDGRLDLLALGEERFRIIELVYDRSYLRAEIEPLNDRNTLAASAKQVHGMIDMFRSFLDRLGLEDKQRVQLEELVVDLELEREVSYVIGQTIGLDAESQMELLAQRTPQARIKLLLHELLRHDQLHQRARELFDGTDFDPTVN